eukprot:TRINITY_DN13521_c0_g1_i1.p1 TRINITY_DN13521_c0_g1~~TRINITY_DN13521_c0_g1_i1.p1  ORF type:complete len:506 (+),score=102.91 TRINITY_DN13521_c0_g1_i1:48-1520(+)
MASSVHSQHSYPGGPSGLQSQGRLEPVTTPLMAKPATPGSSIPGSIGSAASVSGSGMLYQVRDMPMAYDEADNFDVSRDNVAQWKPSSPPQPSNAQSHSPSQGHSPSQSHSPPQSHSPLSHSQRSQRSQRSVVSSQSGPWRPSPGSRVRRNPAFWTWGDQDGGGEGTVVTHDASSGWVTVKWEANGCTEKYRWGAEDAYDIEGIAPPMDVVGELALPCGRLVLDNRSRQELKDTSKRDIAQALDVHASIVSIESIQATSGNLITRYRVRSSTNEKSYLTQARGKSLLESRRFHVPSLLRAMQANVAGTPPKGYLAWNRCWIDTAPVEDAPMEEALPQAPTLANIHHEEVEVEAQLGSKVVVVGLRGNAELLLVANVREMLKQKLPELLKGGFFIQRDGVSLDDAATLREARIGSKTRLTIVPMPSSLYPHRASTPPPKSPSPYERLQHRVTPPSSVSSHNSPYGVGSSYYNVPPVTEDHTTQYKMKSLFS